MSKRRTIITLVSIFAVFIIIVIYFSTVTYKAVVNIDGKSFSVEVADTQYLLEKGLSGHAPISNAQGMLFIFQKPDNYGFWMKDMLFPLDIIWIDQNFKIVHIEKSLSPETYPKIFYSGTPAMYVLEINAGLANSFGFNISDSVHFSKKWF